MSGCAQLARTIIERGGQGRGRRSVLCVEEWRDWDWGGTPSFPLPHAAFGVLCGAQLGGCLPDVLMGRAGSGRGRRAGFCFPRQLAAAAWTIPGPLSNASLSLTSAPWPRPPPPLLCLRRLCRASHDNRAGRSQWPLPLCGSPAAAAAAAGGRPRRKGWEWEWRRARWARGGAWGWQPQWWV